MAMEQTIEHQRARILIDGTRLFFDVDKQCLFKNGEVFRLDLKVARLLNYFLEHANRTITRAELLEHVWNGQQVTNDAINRAVSVLRKALGGNKDQYVITIPKVGYRFNLSTADLPCSEDEENKKTKASENSAPGSLSSASTHHPAEVLPAQSINKLRRPTLAALILFVLVFAMSLIWKLPLFSVFDTRAVKGSENLSNRVAKDSKSMTHIAVLPLVTSSDSDSLKVMATGLIEDLQHNLSRISGILVTLAPSSVMENTELFDAEDVSRKTGAQFALKGSILQSGDTYKITAQLFDLTTGQLVFSKVFQQTEASLFDLQREISQQLVAALQITLIERPNMYSNMAMKMDYAAVETLYRARAKVYRYTEGEIRSAISDLEQLSQQYPNTPEILGLLAFARFQLGTSSTNSLEFIQQSMLQAQSVLAIDPINFYALTTLANTQIIFPDLRQSAFEKVKVLLREYPGRKEVYNILLFHLSFMQAPCDQLKFYIGLIPKSLYGNDPRPLQALNEVIAPCAGGNPEPTAEQYLNPFYLWFSYALNIPGDPQYHAVQHFSSTYPNQRYLSELYWIQLLLNDEYGALESLKGIEKNPHAAWSVNASIYSYLRDKEAFYKPTELGDFMRVFYRNTPIISYSAAMIKQAREEGNTELVVEYLKSMPKFEVTPSTLNESFALLILLQELEDKTKANQVAQQLLHELVNLRDNDPASYQFWKQAPYALVTAIYADDIELANKILREDLSDDYPLWYFNSALLEVILHNYRELPVATEFLSKVEQDVERMRRENFISR
jgi:DNA-binding winged helix-turn-helix (wHTH) protein/TolB-like protein